MKDEPNNDIPKYLEEFLEPTRSSIEKLLAAFDGLSVETQIKLLSTIEGKLSQWEFPNITYLYKKVFLKAFESPNSYVRYLSVRNLVSIMYGDDEELNNFIAKDIDSYIEIAIKMANDKGYLQIIRQGLRDRMQQSSLCDAKIFARNVEYSYQNMWEQYLNSG